MAMETVNIFTVSCEIIAISVMLSIFSVMIAQFYCRVTTKTRKIKWNLKLINLVCIGTFISVAVLDMTHILLSEHYQQPLSQTGNNFNWIRISNDTAYFVSMILMYTIFIIKLSIFNGTLYRVKCRFYTLFVVLFAIFIVCAILFEYDLILYNTSADKIALRRIPYIVLLILIDIALNVSISWMFVSKLQQIVLDMAMDELQPVSSDISEQRLRSRSDSVKHSLEMRLNLNQRSDRKMKMIVVMTRWSINCVIQAVCNQLFFIMLIVVGVLDGMHWRNDSKNLNSLYSMCYLLRAVQITIDSTILFCNFDMNKHVYHRLCGCIERVCYRHCVQKTIDNVLDELQ